MSYNCPDCGASYNIFFRMEKDTKIRCPTCLKLQTFSDGWLLDVEDSSFLKNILSKIHKIAGKS